MKFWQHSKRHTNRHRPTIGRSETLEPRCMLDGASLLIVEDQVSTRQNGPEIELDVLANDIFQPNYVGDKLITAVSYGSQGGFIEISNDANSINYRPPADFHGTEKFTYFVDNQAFASVLIDVESPLQPDEFTIPPDGITRSLDLMENDPFWEDYDGPKQITLVSTTINGSELEIAEDGKSVLYTPSIGEGRFDKFTYIVDGLYSSFVSIDYPKTLESDEYEVIQNTGTHEFRVLSNDPFWPTYQLPKQITAVSESRLGTLEIADDGKSILYTPNDDMSGWDSFTYVVDDTYESYASVIVHRPVQDDRFEIDFNSTGQHFNVTANDVYHSRNDGRRDIIDRVTGVGVSEAGAEVSIAADGQSIIYSAVEGFSGNDTITYTADGLHTATVTVSVTRPVRDDYGFYRTVFQDTPDAFLDVLEND